MHGAIAGVVERNFDTRGGLVGGWPPRKRSAEPVTHPLMQATGGLRRSLTRRGATGAVFTVTRDTVTYGSSLPHALAEAADVLTAAALLAAGFHTHNRQWRRRRGANHD